MAQNQRINMLKISHQNKRIKRPPRPAIIPNSQFCLKTSRKGPFLASDAGKVYFMQGHYDVKLQADNRVRWDVVLRD